MPNYGIYEVVRLADIISGSIRNWQRLSHRPSPLTHREPGNGLSNLQLIELAVVAAERAAERSYLPFATLVNT